MRITIDRKYKKAGYVISNLYVDGVWFCNSLEPPQGDATKTITPGSKKAIASGTYNIALCWSPRFKKQMPYLENVPGRSAIMIHPGNYPRDSVGCILVGRNTAKGMLTESTATTNRLIEKIRQSLVKEESVTIEIK